MTGRRVLLAERDAARAERRVREAQAETTAMAGELEQSKQENAAQLRGIGLLQAELAKLYSSTSWRWSAPLRAISVALQRDRPPLGDAASRHSDHAVAPVKRDPPPALSLREQALLHRLRGG